MLDTLWQDIRYAFRSLWRTPGFAAIAVLTLALGIGANTAIFSVVNGVVLRPLGYPKPEQLMYLTTRFPGLGFEQFWVSAPEYFEFRELNRSFSDVGAFQTGEVNLTAGDRALRVRAANVDDHLLRALGLQPAHGRFFASGETDVSGPPAGPGRPAPRPRAIAILSHELWQRAFGGQPMVGQSIAIDGVPRQVIGIMPPGADLVDNHTEVWLPIGLNPANRQNRPSHTLYVIGRLRDGVTPLAAQAELDALIPEWGTRAGVTGHVFAPLSAGPTAHFLQMKPLLDEVLGTASRSVWILQAAVGLVLLIASANLASLLLARAETRHRELAVRIAVGAGPRRLLRQFVTEGLLLAAGGGVAGVLLAHVGLQVLTRVYPSSLPRTAEVAVDATVLLFTLGLSAAVGVLFGLAPLAQARAIRLVTALKEGVGRGAASSTRSRARAVLITGEVALAMLLAAGAGLLVRTVYNLTAVDAGFDRSRLVTFELTLPRASYPPPARVDAYARVLDGLRAVAGIRTATAMTGLPPARPLAGESLEIEGRTRTPGDNSPHADHVQGVMSVYFDTMGIPIVQGRAFEVQDAGAEELVAVVNETMAKRFWGDQSPVGRRFRFSGDNSPWFHVVGVSRDVKQSGVDHEPGTETHFLVEQAHARRHDGGPNPADHLS